MSEQQEQIESGEPQVEPQSGKGPEVILTQWDYIAPPFRDERWEVLGERRILESFMPIELCIVQTPEYLHDAVSEEFATPDDSQAYRRDSAGDARKALQQEYQRGFAEAQEQAAELHKQLSERLAQMLKSVEAGREQLYKTIEQEALNLALAVARQVLALTAEVKPEYIVDVIREGLKSLGAAKPMRIRMSAADLEFVHVVGMPAELSAQELGIQYVSDESIKSGCVIETDFGETDLQLDHMLEQVKETLYEVTR